MSKKIIIAEKISKIYYKNNNETESVSGHFSWRKLFGTAKQNTNTGNAFEALHNISFTLEEGSVLGIIGRNGAGKSTLLQVLSQIVAPTAGNVWYNGKIAAVLDIGTGFHPDLSGRENIYFSGALWGMSKNTVKSRFDEIVDFSGIGDFIDTPVKHYSSGMYVRLAFSVMAFLEADILLFDEVLAVGDMQFRMKVFDRIKEIAKSGAIVLMASHDLDQISRLCNRCIWLHKGQLVNDGTPTVVTEKYMESYLLQAMGYNELTLTAGSTLPAPPAVREWKPGQEPRNEIMCLTKVQIKVPDQQTDGVTIYMNTPFYFEMEYIKLQSGFPTNFYIAIFHISGVPVLSAVNPLTTIDTEAGKYSIGCHIPADLLNHGLFYIDIWTGDKESKHIFNVQKVIFFQVRCLPELEHTYWREVDAHIRPQLQWKQYRS